MSTDHNIDEFDDAFVAEVNQILDDIDVADPIDIVETAAAALLTAQYPSIGEWLKSGLHVFVAPNINWVAALGDAIIAVGQSAKPANSAGRRSPSSSRQIWIDWMKQPPEDDALQLRVGKIAEALHMSQTVAIVTHDLSCVPQVIKSAADHIVALGPFSAESFQQLLITAFPKICGKDTSGEDASKLNNFDWNLSSFEFASITPAALQLSWHTKIDPKAFVEKLKATVLQPVSPKKARRISLEEIRGADKAHEWAQILKADIDAWRTGEVDWDDCVKGLLLAGPPGTGKTTLARAIADHAQIAFVGTSYADWQSNGTGHLGPVIKGLIQSFTEARRLKPAVLFIDEIDSIGARGGSERNSDWWRSIINALLEQLNTDQDNEGLVVLAATNAPERLDPALVRSGRIEDRIDLGLPDVVDLIAIIHDQLRGNVLPDADLRLVGQLMLGSTGADVVKICKSARRLARVERRPVSHDDLLSVLNKGAEEQTEQMKYRAAVHEAGHCIVALSSSAIKLHGVSLVGPRGSGGQTVWSFAESAYLMRTTLSPVSAHETDLAS